jgi:DNA topoisomerase-1
LQYRYHARWRAARDADKYGRLLRFCRALPRLRRRVTRDLHCACTCRASVAAAVVALLERGHLRIGNDEYARANHTYGATTLETRHVRVRGGHLELSYRGKSGKQQMIEVDDSELGRAIARVRSLPGRRLFQYLDGDARHALTSNDVNRYLHETIGDGFSAKDFRTWAATISCALGLASLEPPASERAAKRAIAEVIRGVADELGHTPAVCRSAYVHPRVLDAFRAGRLPRAFPPRLRAVHPDVRAMRQAEPYLARVLTAPTPRPPARRAKR